MEHSMEHSMERQPLRSSEERRARPSPTLLGGTPVVIGHSCMGHNYIGRNYIGPSGTPVALERLLVSSEETDAPRPGSRTPAMEPQLPSAYS